MKTRFKIIKIKGCKTCKEVLLQIIRTEDGDDELEITAWHLQKDIAYYQIETVTGPIGVLESLISDFSEFSANQFANSFVF